MSVMLRAALSVKDRADRGPLVDADVGAGDAANVRVQGRLGPAHVDRAGREQRDVRLMGTPFTIV